MSSQIVNVEFKAGDTLFEEHEQTYHFYIIQEGTVEIFKTTAAGKRIHLAVVQPGASIGEFAMIDRMPRSATAVAQTNVRAARVSQQAYEQLLSELPDWAVSVMRALVDRIRNMNELVRSLETIDADTRHEIDVIEYDSEVNSTITDSNPMIGEPEPPKKRRPLFRRK